MNEQRHNLSPGVMNGGNDEVHKENESITASVVETDRQQGDSVCIDQCPKTDSEIRENLAFMNQKRDSMPQNVETGLAGSWDQSSYVLSGSMQFEKENEDCAEAVPALSNESVFQHRGIPRRCLQFEDTPHTVISNQPAPHSGTTKSPLEAPLTPVKENLPHLCASTMNTTVKIPKPSGIGLHLNSIINAVQAGSGAIIHVKSAQRCNISVRGKDPIPITNTHLSDSSNNTSVFTTAEDVPASMDDNKLESHALLAVDSITSLSTNIIKPSNNSIILNPLDDQPNPGEKRKFLDIETDGNSEEFKSCPKKKRNKSSDHSGGDGCKRCNCKKSRCLKLYCDCFAAGLYCAGPCACQGCYNKPEYVDTVLQTRQQIESRNPLAFAPKVVQHIIEPLEDAHSTPSLARHKRGCNCKKSMCLKKYCECYQANVGCSDGCGCEGCKNVYGRKGENGMGKDVLSKESANEITDGSLIEEMALITDRNLTPITPAVQSSNQRNNEPKAWVHSTQHFQSPESGLTSATPSAITARLSRISDESGMISQTVGEILDLVSSDQQLLYGNSETPDEFSALCRQPGKAGNHSRGQKFTSGHNPYSSMSSLSRLGSPNTPMSQSNVSRPLNAVDLESDLSNTGMQDDTPDILNDGPTPARAVKVSSPNKKRVSPPHGSSSLHGLRTGRKFILKAISSFPPLTPCVDPKSFVARQTNNPKNHTCNR